MERSLSAKSTTRLYATSTGAWGSSIRYTNLKVERKSAANEMFNISNDDWRDKVDAVLDSMDAVILRGGRNETFNLSCKLP
jgi:hypothetical protein